MFEIFGFIASFCFIICGIPQMIMCIKRGHADGVSRGFLWLWLLGEFSLLIYASLGLAWNIPLLLNAAFCTLICIVILKYVYIPRKRKDVLIPSLYLFRRFKNANKKN